MQIGNNGAGRSNGRAVLLVDMQPPFVKRIRMEDRRRIISAQEKVLDYCIQHDLPVAVIEMNGCGGTINPLDSIVDGIPRHGFVAKGTINAFTDSVLLQQLRKWEASSVYLMGIYASCCVRHTAEGALNYGFDVFTSDDVITNPSGAWEDATKGTIDWFKRNGSYHRNHTEVFR